MKINQIILLGLFLAASALLYFSVSSNKKPLSKDLKKEESTQYVPIKIAKNEMRERQLISYGQIAPVSEVDVSFEVQGKLIQGDKFLKPGVKFSKGQVLYRVDNEEAFYNLSSRKMQFSNLILGALPDFELDYPSEKNKWNNYLNSIKANERLPDLPQINSSRERMFLTSRNILSEYFNIRSLESRMEKYFFIAPFSGTVIEVFAEPGSIANPGGRIARIAKTGDYEVKVPINVNDLQKFKEQHSAIFTEVNGKLIGQGSILRVSDVINQRTQSADVYYSIKPKSTEAIYNGMFLNVVLKQSAEIESVSVPRLAMKDGKVLILENEHLITRQVIVVSSKPDTVFVTGIKNGEQLLLEQIEIKKGTVYKGIQR